MSHLLDNLWRGSREVPRGAERFPAPCGKRPAPSYALFKLMYFDYFLFPQKSLPQLENEIKEKQQTITEELQKYGTEIPEDESEKMFFLIEVSVAYGVELKNPDPTVCKGPCALCPCVPFCPLSARKGPRSRESGQGGVRRGGWSQRAEWSHRSWGLRHVTHPRPQRP